MEVLEQAKIVSPYSDDRGAYSHTGVDVLSNVNNRNVRAVARGKVIEVQNRMEDSFIVNQKSPTYLWAGNYVVIEHGNGYVSRYNHLKYNSINVNVGDIVEEGHEFAQEGESGYATGVHLDFEVKQNGKFVDPSQYALGQANLPAYEEPKPVETPVQEQPVEQPQVDILDLVRRTIRGDFGNGQARKDALGPNYDEVQRQVNLNLQNGLTQWNSIRLF